MDVPVVVVLAVSMVSPAELLDVAMVEVDVPRWTVTRSATLELEMFSRSAMNALSATPAGVGRAAPCAGVHGVQQRLHRAEQAGHGRGGGRGDRCGEGGEVRPEGDLRERARARSGGIATPVLRRRRLTTGRADRGHDHRSGGERVRTPVPAHRSCPPCPRWRWPSSFRAAWWCRNPWRSGPCHCPLRPTRLRR